MSSNERGVELADVTGRVVAAAQLVAERIGGGFSKYTYQQCLARELAQTGLTAAIDRPVALYHEGEPVGHVVADLLVGDCVMVEVESSGSRAASGEAGFGIDLSQATGHAFCLRLIFQPDGLHVVRFSALR